jgi:flagellar biosynthesis protein FliQ
MNWGLFALSVSALLIGAWIVLAVRRKPSPMALVASFACVLAASLNSAAPFRGAIDPGYMGYVFGLLAADKGLAVTALAGSVFVGALVAAFIALTRRSGRALWWVSGVCGALSVILGGPWLIQSLTDPSSNAIQFGEYLTVPGLVSTIVLFALFVLPFALGTVWAARSAKKPAGH